MTEAVLYSVADAAAALGISRSAVWELLQSGEIASVKYGKRRLIPAESLHAFAAALPRVEPQHTANA